MHHGGQQRGAIAHSRVHNLPLASSARIQYRCEEPEGHQHSAAAEIANQVYWHHRTFGGPNRIQDTAERDIV
ncbi:hypothetical protein D9M72_647980 [compost metagenome]